MEPQKKAMKMKTCLGYFENPVIVELVSSRLADGLEKRLFQTFIRDIPGSGAPLTTFESMNRDDLVAAAREGHFGAVKWLHNCLTEVPENG